MLSRVLFVLVSGLFLVACKSPYEYKLPTDVEKLKSNQGLKQALTKLQDDEKALVARYMMRAALAKAFAQDAPERTIRQAIENQREFEQVRERGLKSFEMFAELDNRETGAFWGCVMAADGVDVGMFSKAEQFQQKIESAYSTQQKTFADHLVTDCVPKIERARQAFGSLRDNPAELAGPIDEYRASLPKLQAGVEEYAEKLKSRGTVKDVDQLIQDMGNAWHSTPDPTPEAAAFEKFMYCAIPGLAKMKDAQAMLEYLADECYKKDPVAFMNRVRTECGPLVSNVDKDAKVDPKSIPTWKASRKAFFEDDARQLAAWGGCGKRSRKAQKKEDMEALLFAVNDYMGARTKVAQAARKIEAAK